MTNFRESFEKYAMLAVEIGVNVQPGQTLYIIAPIIAADFVRQVTNRSNMY
jgi:aminopeptidase